MKSEMFDTSEASNNWYRAPHITKEESIGFEPRWVLQCLVRGVSGTGTLSKISIKKICSWCAYTDNDGNYHSFGKDRLQKNLNILVTAGKIIINQPVRGGCTTYTINGLNKFEPVPDALYYLPLSPEQKGYILFMLEHNVNNHRKRKGQSYSDTIAECDYHEADLAETSHMSMAQIRKIESSLMPYGILSIEETSKRHSDSGTPIISRKLDLEKLGLVGRQIQVNTNFGKQFDEIYDLINDVAIQQLTKNDVEQIVTEVLTKLNCKK